MWVPDLTGCFKRPVWYDYDEGALCGNVERSFGLQKGLRDCSAGMEMAEKIG